MMPGSENINTDPDNEYTADNYADWAVSKPDFLCETGRLVEFLTWLDGTTSYLASLLAVEVLPIWTKKKIAEILIDGAGDDMVELVKRFAVEHYLKGESK